MEPVEDVSDAEEDVHGIQGNNEDPRECWERIQVSFRLGCWMLFLEIVATRSLCAGDAGRAGLLQGEARSNPLSRTRAASLRATRILG